MRKPAAAPAGRASSAEQCRAGKATFAACEWIKKNCPGGANYVPSGNVDTDERHSRANMLLTRGKRVVAECTIRGDQLKSLMGIRWRGSQPLSQVGQGLFFVHT